MSIDRDIQFYIDAGDFDADIQDVLNGLGNLASKVVNRSLNATIASTRTYVKSETRKRVPLTAKSVHKRISLFKSTERSLYAELGFSDSKFKLHSFATQRELEAQAKKRASQSGVKVAVLRGDKREYAGTFAQKVRGRWMIFQRVGADKYPLELPVGPSLGEILQKTPILENASHEAERLFYVKFRQQSTTGKNHIRTKSGKTFNLGKEI